MRILHARLRDVAVRAVPANDRARRASRCSRPVGQSVPLHRLPPDHRSGLPHGRLSAPDHWGRGRRVERGAERGAARHAARIGAASARVSSRRVHSKSWPRRSKRSPRRCIGRRHRYRTVGDQAAAGSAADRLSRGGRGTQRNAQRVPRHRDRSGRVAGGWLERDRRRLSAARRIAQRFGSPPVRNSGTLCGNLANGSPIGDAMPILIALGAEIELRRGSARGAAARRILFGLPAQGSRARRIHRIGDGAAKPRATEWVASYKLSKRFRPGYFGGLRGVRGASPRWARHCGAHRVRRHGGDPGACAHTRRKRADRRRVDRRGIEAAAAALGARISSR
jgi:hypothetical protein